MEEDEYFLFLGSAHSNVTEPGRLCHSPVLGEHPQQSGRAVPALFQSPSLGSRGRHAVRIKFPRQFKCVGPGRHGLPTRIIWINGGARPVQFMPYTIIGSDGQQYGPITAEDVRRWIA